LVGSVNDDIRPINHDRVAASYFCRILIHMLACVEPSPRSYNRHERRLLTGYFQQEMKLLTDVLRVDAR
jgi:hypothetical protein